MTLRPATTVRRVIVEAGRCRGVELVRADGAVELVACALVVLCAGAYGTPEILLRSGIGPEEVGEAGVELVHRLDGVGRNLQDHPWCLLDVIASDPSAPAQRPVSGALLRYEPTGGHDEAQIFPFQSQPYDPAAPAAQVSVAAALMTPRSRGYMRLDREGAVEIRLRHLNAETDVTAMATVVSDAADLVDDLVDRGVLLEPSGPWWREHDLGAACRQVVSTYNHPVGTCRMGAVGSPDTVVTTDLRIVGIEGLAVADASIIPTIPRANTNLAAMMIGWRAGHVLTA